MNYASFYSTTMLTAKIIKETIENLFQFNLDIPWNYLWCWYEKDTSAQFTPFWKVRGNAPALRRPCLQSAVSVSSRCITFQDVCVQPSHAAKRLLS